MAVPDAFTVQWSVPFPASPMFPPMIAGDRVLLAHLPGILAAYDLADGRRLWQADLNPVQPPVVDGERIFVASETAVQAVRASDGTPVWRVEVEKPSAPLVAKDGWLIVASGATLRALRGADGSVVWSRAAAPQREAATVSGDVLFVPATDGWIRAHDILTGAVLWERQLGGAPAEPLVVGDGVYFGASDKQFYCLHAETGERRWTMRVGAALTMRASSDGTRVYFAALDNLIRAVDRGHGGLRWQHGVAFRPLTGPVPLADLVFVGGPTADVQMLRVRDGRAAGTVRFPDRLVVAPSVVDSPSGPLVAGVTGSLEQSWTLSLASRKPAAETPAVNARRLR